MLAVKRIITFTVLFFHIPVFAICKAVSLSGFTKIKSKNGIQAFVNEEKTATFAVQCQAKSVSDQEALVSFSKIGEVRKISDSLYSVDKKIAGVITRNYLFLSRDLYQMSFIVKSETQLKKLEEDLQQNLKTFHP